MTSDDGRAASGVLFVVGVPIGNLEDVTVRALRIFRHVDLIASEDPAATQRLLARHNIDAVVTSYGPGNLKDKVAVLLERLRRGARIALVSDCGTPVVADPGCLLIASAHAHNIRVTSVPGPSAVTAAVAAAGLSGDSFYFLGELPATPSGLRRCLTACLKHPVPTVAFCPSGRLRMALRIMAQIAPRHRIVLACGLTTVEETIVRGTARQAQTQAKGLRTDQPVTLIIPKGGGAGPRYSFSSRRIKTR